MRNFIKVIVVGFFCVSPIFSQSDEQEPSDNYDDLINALDQTIDENEKKIKENEQKINEEANKHDPYQLENEWNKVTESLNNEFAQCLNESKAQKAELAELRNKTLQNDAALNDKDIKIAELNKNFNDLQTNNLKNAQVLGNILNEFKTMQSTLDDRNKKIVELEAENKERGKELTVRDYQITQLTTKLTKSETELKTRSQSLEECRSQAQSLQSNIKSHDNSNKKKDQELNLKDDKIAQLISKLTQSEIELKTSTQTLEKCQSNITSHNISNKKKDQELNFKDDKIAQLNNKLNKSEIELKTLSKSLEECQFQAERLQSNIASNEISIKEKDKEISKLRTSNKQNNATHEIAQMNLKTCQSSLEKTQKENAEKQTKNDATHNKKKNEVRKQIDDLKNELQMVNEQLTKCESLKKTVGRNYEDLKKETNKNSTDQSNALSQCQLTLTSCQSKTTSLEAEVKQKIAENNNFKRNNEKCNGSLVKCESSRKQVESNYEDLRQKSKEKDVQIKSFGDQMSALSQCQANSTSCQTKTTMLKAQIEDLTRRYVECRDLLANSTYCEKKTKEIEWRAKNTSNELGKCISSKKTMETNLEALTKESNQKDDQLTKINEYQRNMTSCNTRVERLHEKCQSDINSYQNDIRNREQENTELKNVLARCESEKRSRQLQDCENKQQRPPQTTYINVDQKETYNRQRPSNQPRNPTVTAIAQPSSCSNSAGIVSIRLQSGYQIPVLCNNNIAGPGWITILRRFNGRLSFEKTWNEYKTGFGDLNGESFLGLQNIYLLTRSTQHELFIQLTDQNNLVDSVRYDYFKIGNEQSQYRLESLGKFSGSVTDDLSLSIDMPFTTPDFGNIPGSRRCASEKRAGWWYRLRVCALTNLHGKYGRQFVWYDRKRGYIYLKEVRMMIRPMYSNSQRH